MMLVLSLKTIQQPDLPKYVASTLRLICLVELSLGGFGGRSRKEWKLRIRVLEDTLLFLLISLRLLIEIPELIQWQKRSKYLVFLRILVKEKVLKQQGHLNLLTDHLMQFTSQEVHLG